MSAFESLDEPSRRVFQRLHIDKPDWVCFASVDVISPNLKMLRVSIPTPSKMETVGFTVDGDELTVLAGVHHIHIGFGGITDTNVVEAFQLLDEVINEATLVISIWKEARMRISFFEDAVKIQQLCELPDGDHHMVIHSWSGAHDSEKTISWPGYISLLKRTRAQ